MDEKTANFLSTLAEPRYSSPDHDPAAPILLTGLFDGKATTFSASPTDTMSYGRELHRRAVSGEMGEIGAYVEPEPTFIWPLGKAE